MDNGKKLPNLPLHSPRHPRSSEDFPKHVALRTIAPRWNSYQITLATIYILTTHLQLLAHITDIFSLAPTPSTLFSASGSSTLHIHSTTSPTFPVAQSISGAHRLGIHHVCTSRGGPGRVAVTAGFGGEIKIWTCKEATGNWELWHEIRPDTPVQSATNDSSATGNGANSSNGNDGTKAGDAWAIALSADENYLAVTTHDGKVHVWDLVGRQRIQTYATGSGSGGGSFGLSVDLSRDGRLTASGHQSGGVYVFNNDTGRMVYSLSGKQSHSTHSVIFLLTPLPIWMVLLM